MLTVAFRGEHTIRLPSTVRAWHNGVGEQALAQFDCISNLNNENDMTKLVKLEMY